ncbi:hypothetical protein MJT46_011159, partial [Ovis ammon polii x Ovis aries]
MFVSNDGREDKGRAERQGVPAAAASPPPRHSSFPAQTGARWERLGTAVSAAVSACRAEPPHAVMREQDLTQGEITVFNDRELSGRVELWLLTQSLTWAHRKKHKLSCLNSPSFSPAALTERKLPHLSSGRAQNLAEFSKEALPGGGEEPVKSVGTEYVQEERIIVCVDLLHIEPFSQALKGELSVTLSFIWASGC